ncbi:hypothetical protein M569_09862, partial [Genlisea aurea]
KNMWSLFRRKASNGFSAASTAEEVTEGIDASGLTAIVTGASSGIGSETARVLALRGAAVVLAIRNMSLGKQVEASILKENPSAQIETMELDLGSLASVKKFATEFKSSGRPLNILINNAGVMAPPFQLSEDQIELQFATNHLGHFLLTNLLLDTMKKTAQQAKREGRIVNVSSEAHRASYHEGIRFDRLNDPKGYQRWGAYGQSKLANILHSNELSARLKEEGADVTANSLHPGLVATNLFRHFGFFGGIASRFGGLVMMKNVQQGASTTCYVALHPEVKGISGEYFSDNNLAKTNSNAADKDLGRKLWDFSMESVK